MSSLAVLNVLAGGHEYRVDTASVKWQEAITSMEPPAYIQNPVERIGSQSAEKITHHL